MNQKIRKKKRKKVVEMIRNKILRDIGINKKTLIIFKVLIV